MMKKRSKLIFIVIAMVLVVGGAVAARYISELSNYRQVVEEITIGEVDLAAVPDGTYSGFADVIWVSATVEVTVLDHRITDIKLDHRHGQGKEAEVIPGQVTAAQSLQVDIISGATSSSKVILKAIDNALLSAAE